MPQPFSPVDVRPASLWMNGGELSGRGGIAQGDERGDGETQQQPRPGALGGRLPHDEHPGADHRAEPDDHGVTGAQAAGQP